MGYRPHYHCCIQTRLHQIHGNLIGSDLGCSSKCFIQQDKASTFSVPENLLHTHQFFLKLAHGHAGVLSSGKMGKNPLKGILPRRHIHSRLTEHLGDSHAPQESRFSSLVGSGNDQGVVPLHLQRIGHRIFVGLQRQRQIIQSQYLCFFPFRKGK